MSTSARCLATADLENKPRERSRGTEQRAPWSRFPGVVTTSACNTMDVSSDFDQCASTGSPEQHGHPQRLLGCGNGHHLLALGAEVARGIGIDVAPGMIELARARLRSSSWRANLAFEVDDAEELEGIADQSIDPAICIGAFEHMLDKRAVLASIYRVLKLGGRFSAKHLSSDRMLNSRRFFRAARSSRVSPHSVRSLDVHFQGGRAGARCITAHGIRCNRATRWIGFSSGRPLIMRLEGGETA